LQNTERSRTRSLRRLSILFLRSFMLSDPCSICYQYIPADWRNRCHYPVRNADHAPWMTGKGWSARSSFPCGGVQDKARMCPVSPARRKRAYRIRWQRVHGPVCALITG
jgi:hypothetical protein